MARYFHATLTVVASIAVTALVMAAVFPAHARSAAEHAAPTSDIRPAVLVEHDGASQVNAAASCPALTQQTAASSCPYLAGKTAKQGRASERDSGTDTKAAECPYLASLAAGSGCPEMGDRSGATACPYLSGKDRRDADRPAEEHEDAPNTLTL